MFFENGELIYINRPVEQVEPHLHAHDFLEIAYVSSGKGIHILGNKKYDVSKGDLFVINYNVAHEFRSIASSDDKLIIYNCVFKPEFLDYTLINCRDFKDIVYHFLFNSLFPQETSSVNDIKLIGKDCTDIEQLYNKMFDEYTNRNSGYVEILRAYLIELLVTIFRKYKESDIKQEHYQIENRKKELIEEAMCYMKENYDKEIKLEELSMISFFSRNYFCKLFKDATGMTVVEYIQRIRIQNACRLLKETNDTVLNIAHQVGYEDCKFFTILFKRYTGYAPSAYRKLSHLSIVKNIVFTPE
jgi:AraC family L-rhamnose operon transcriptional activator RhaR